MNEPLPHWIGFDPLKEAVLQKRSAILASSYSRYTKGQVNEAEAKKFFDDILSTMPGAAVRTDTDKVIKQLQSKKRFVGNVKTLEDYLYKDLNRGLVQSYKGYTFPCDEIIVLVIKTIAVAIREGQKGSTADCFYEGDKVNYEYPLVDLIGNYGQYFVEAAMLYGQCLAYKNGMNRIQNQTRIEILREKYTDSKSSLLALAGLKQPLTAFKKLLAEHELVATAKLHFNPPYINASEAITKISINIHAADEQGDTLAHHFAANGDIKNLQQLTAKAVNFNVFNKLDCSPLHVATPEAAEFLLKNGMLVDYASATGMTPLHYAAQQGYHEQAIKVAQILVSAGAHIGAKDKNGKTPLHLATEKQRVDIIKFFLEAKVDPNITDNEGKTPLHQVVAAVYYNDEQVIKVV